MAFRSTHIRWIVFGLAIFMSLPFLPAPFSGLYLWGSPFIMFNSAASGKSLAWLHLFGLATLVAVIFKRRWICRYACPTGVICDLSSSARGKRRKDWKFPINRYLAVFAITLALFNIPVLMVIDPFNLFFMGFEGFRTGFGLHAIFKLSGIVFLIVFSLLLPHAWCKSVCPLGGMQLLFNDLKKRLTQPKNPEASHGDRRTFLAGLAGILGGLLIPRLMPGRDDPQIRPPFALPEDELNMTCTRCGNCSSACPTNIIFQSLDVKKPERLLTPVVSFLDSYCLPECNECGKACPSGAIQQFVSEDKKHHVMGIARIQLERCYHQDGRECNQCRNYCRYNAIEMKKTALSHIILPNVVKEKCVGCGACQVVCPPRVIEIVPPS